MAEITSRIMKRLARWLTHPLLWAAIVAIGAGTWFHAESLPDPAWVRTFDRPQRILGFAANDSEVVLQDLEDNRRLTKLDVVTGRPIAQTVLDVPGRPLAAEPFRDLLIETKLAPDGKRVTATRNAYRAGKQPAMTAEIFDFESGRVQTRYQHDVANAIAKIGLSPDGRFASIGHTVCETLPNRHWNMES